MLCIFIVQYFNVALLLSQPEVSKYHAELMPLLLGYLSLLNEARIGHVTKAFYALENFLENLGKNVSFTKQDKMKISVKIFRGLSTTKARKVSSVNACFFIEYNIN